MPLRDVATSGREPLHEVAMRIGIIGAGMIGSTLSRLWSEAGHEVRLASRHPEHLTDLVKRLGKLASTGTPTDAAEFGDVVMLTVPLKAVPDLADDLRSSLSGKVVLDTGNAYERRDGAIARQASEHPLAPRAGGRRCSLRLAGSKPSTRWTSRHFRVKRIEPGIASESRSPETIQTPFD
jgi:prephenate dehydrogenase